MVQVKVQGSRRHTGLSTFARDRLYSVSDYLACDGPGLTRAVREVWTRVSPPPPPPPLSIKPMWQLYSLRGTMCLEYPPSYRARLAVYVALLCNGIPAPADTEESWALAMEFGEERLLKSRLRAPLSFLSLPPDLRHHSWYL